MPAGTILYWNGWLFMGILFIPMFFAGIWMMLKNPELLRKRLHTRETQAEQALVIKLSGLMFVAGFVLAGAVTLYMGWRTMLYSPVSMTFWPSWTSTVRDQ